MRSKNKVKEVQDKESIKDEEIKIKTEKVKKEKEIRLEKINDVECIFSEKVIPSLKEEILNNHNYMKKISLGLKSINLELVKVFNAFNKDTNLKGQLEDSREMVQVFKNFNHYRNQLK